MKLLFANIVLLAFSFTLRAQDSVSTLAGQAGLAGTADGTDTNALFNTPAGIAVDTSGNLYIADSANNTIRLLATNGTVRTFAGQPGVAGSQDGTGTNAQFNAPGGLAFDHGGNLLVADTGNATLRKITPAGGVSTLAGVAGQAGYADGASSAAQFSAPLSLAVATNGSVYIADGGNHVIRVLSGGTVSTFAGNPQVWGSADGNGTNAEFNAPCGLAFDSTGNLFVSDANNHTIRKITPAGTVSTFAGQAGMDGSADGPGSTARFCHPAQIAFDRHGNLLVADSFNDTLREITANGVVSTISGLTGASGGADGLNGAGRYFNPYGLAFASDGSLRVADAYNQLIREVLVPFTLNLQLTKSPPTVTLTWDAVIGRTYQVQYSTNLVTGWMNLNTPLTAGSNSLSATDSASGGRRHYRVLLWP